MTLPLHGSIFSMFFGPQACRFSLTKAIREIITNIRASEDRNAVLKHYKALQQVSLRMVAITRIARSVLVVISPYYDLD